MIVFKHSGLRSGDHKIGNFRRDAALAAGKESDQTKPRHSGRVIESNKAHPSSFLVDKPEDADEDGQLDSLKERKRKDKLNLVPGDALTREKVSKAQEKRAKAGRITREDAGILELEGSEEGSEEDLDSEEEFEKTGIRFEKGKKKMRGKNKIGKRLKKAEVAKGAEVAADKRKRNKTDMKNRMENESDSEVDVEADGALARFRKRQRRQVVLKES